MRSPDRPIVHRPMVATAFMWVGGVLFVGSLLYFLYFYLIRLDRPVPSGGLPALTIDVALFSIFALHHSIMARSGAKRWLARLVPAELERSTYVWMASLLFLLTCAAWRPIGGALYEARGSLAAALYAVQGAGVAMTLVATAALRPLELAGVQTVDGAPGALKTSGVYGLVRHPVYFGWVLFVFGAPRMTLDRFVFAVISTAYLAMAVPLEEASLIETFGEGYRDYARKVRWRILPWVY